MSITDSVREQRAKALDDAQAIVAVAETEGRSLTDAEKADFDALIARAKDLKGQAESLAELAEARSAALPAVELNVGGAVVRNEARTYTAESALREKRSFFADAYNAERGYDRAAAERIERHMTEWRRENRDITTSTLNGLIPPQYMLDQFANLARGGRNFADVIPGYALPDTGMTLYATRVVTGTATAVQATQNSGANEQDMTTTDISIPVVTIAGQQDVSRQALERGAITDSLVMADLIDDYSTKLDTQLFNGTGSNNQHTGVLTLSGTNAVTFSTTAVTTFMVKLAQAVSAVNENRYKPATVIVMHPRRWGWLCSQSDTTGRPLVDIAGGASGMNVFGKGTPAEYGFVGSIFGVPVVTDGNIPLVGASTIDNVIVTRAADQAIWEAGVSTFRFEETAGGPQTIRLALMGYSGFTAGRRPNATSVITGTGMVIPSWS